MRTYEFDAASSAQVPHFPDVSAVCRRLGIRSHGLAMYLLEGADDRRGVACLGGECFGPAGQGFLRFSCAEPDERLHQAVAFLKDAVTRTERVQRYLERHVFPTAPDRARNDRGFYRAP